MVQTMLNATQVQQFHDNGYLVLNEAIAKEHIKRLKNAALEIVDDFDINKHKSTFSTRDSDSGRDDYF